MLISKMTNRVTRSLIAMMFAVSADATAVEYRMYDSNGKPIEAHLNGCAVVISGEITKSLPKQLEDAFAELKDKKECSWPTVVRMDSLGGDIEAAIAAGAIIRSNKSFTSVPLDAACASACALTFLGGVTRMVFGRTGLHRPYSNRHSNSTAEAKANYLAINDAITRYLSIMNAPTEMLTVMNSISPSDIKWLSSRELTAMLIEGTDPVWEDEVDSAIAKRLKISKQELYARRSKAAVVCRGLDQMEKWHDCYSLIVEGKLRRQL
jgi:hypothetical protein